MIVLEYRAAAAAAAAALSSPSSFLMRIASSGSPRWATFPMQRGKQGMSSSTRGRQWEVGQQQRRVVTKAMDEQGAAGGKDRAVVMEENMRLLAMQKELLNQIEERQRLLSSSSTSSTGQQTSGTEPDIDEASSSGRPSSSPILKRSARSDRAAGAPPISPPEISRPAGYPEPSAEAEESKREFHRDHSREGTRGTASQVPEPAQTDAAAPSSEEKPPPLAGPNVMNIVVVAAECAPWSKTGGLGDVVGALPKALARRGHRVMVVSPRYSNYAEAWETGVRRIYNVAGQDMEVGYFHGFIDSVDFFFIDNPNFHSLPNNIYGGSREDVLHRMILLSKAAVEIPWHVPCGGVCYGDGNLVFIANDWHTALVPVYLQANYRDNGFMKYVRSVLIIHNMAHQGRGPLTDFARLGLPDNYIDKFRFNNPGGGNHSNIFMAGLITAHRIVTVSHGYAWEVQTREGGWGLDGIIREHNWKLRGVVNGIDDQEWNPEVDVHLQSNGYSNYNAANLDTGKAACKAALQRELGLPVRPDVPLLGSSGGWIIRRGSISSNRLCRG